MASLLIFGALGASPLAAEEAEKLKELKEAYKDAIEDSVQKSGLFTLRKKEGRLYAELSAKHLGKQFLFLTSISKGVGQGWLQSGIMGMSQERVLEFRKVDWKIQVLHKNTRFKAKDGSPMARAVKTSFTDSIVDVFEIEAVSAEGAYLVDVSSLFLSDTMGLSDAIRASLGGGYSLSSAGTRTESWKVFPENLEIRSLLNYRGSGGSSDQLIDESSFDLGIHTSVLALPGSDYKERLGDDRVGYFMVAEKDYSKKDPEDTWVRKICRWHLEKADPEVESSPVRKSVVFYLDRSIPYRWRPYVRRGLLEWNKAFAKVGLVDAIEVRQQGPQDTWDPEDIRYNTIRWGVGDMPFGAIGPSHVDPRTGQILDADILFSADIVRGFRRTALVYGLNESQGGSKKAPLAVRTEAETAQAASDWLEEIHSSTLARCGHPLEDLTAYMAQEFPLAALHWLHRHQPEARVEAAPEATKPKKSRRKKRRSKKSKKGKKAKKGKKDDDSNDEEEAAAEAKGSDSEAKSSGDSEGSEEDADGDEESSEDKDKEDEVDLESLPEAFIGAALKYIVMHEVGHTLGLRHNFKASSIRSLKQLSDRSFTEKEGLSGSVMDYLPVHLSEPGEPQGEYFPSTIGPYDYWAIEYGYKPFKDEDKERLAVAARSAEPDLAYGTDEDRMTHGARNIDPLTQAGDLSDDALAYARRRAKILAELWKGLPDRIVPEGKAYWWARWMVGALAGATLSDGVVASQFLGGIYKHRDHRGDPNERPIFVPVPKEKQLEALAFLEEVALNPASYPITPKLYRHLPAKRWLHWGSWNGDLLLPLHDMMLRIQARILQRPLSGPILDRLLDLEKLAGDPTQVLTASELLDRLQAQVFPRDKKDVLLARSSFDRALQRIWVETFGGNLHSSLGQLNDRRALSLEKLEDLRQLLQASKDASGLSRVDRAHRQDLLDRLDQIFRAVRLRGN